MTAIDTFLHELEAALRVHGRARRRLLAECREHLTEAAAVLGVDDAVRRFGPAADLARSFDAEVAVRQGMRATVASIAGVLAVAFSTWSMLNAADPHASAVAVWAVVFFGCAQTAGVSTLLASLRAAAMRRRPATPAEVALLCRRNLVALIFAMVTLFAAGAAVPGHTSAWRLLLGPAVALVAAAGVLRARALARRIDKDSPRAVRAPLADLLIAIRRPGAITKRTISSSSIVLLGPTVVLASAAAFVWDHLDHGSLSTSVAAAGIEAALTLAGFVLLGPALGLRGPRSQRPRGTPA